jgi:hypothetical protein
MHLTVTDATHRIYCRVPGWKSNVQRVIKNAKNTTFLQSLTRDISQTNEPISEKLCRIEDRVILYRCDENI